MEDEKVFEGLYTALITPFNEDGSLDTEGFRQLVQRQVEARVDGVLVLGSTGEAPTLTEEEGELLMTIAREETFGKTALIAGVGTYSTAQSVAKAKKAQQLNVDALMAVNPYYNKPTQEGLYCHFRAIAEASSLPLMLYNHPGRTGVSLQLDTVKRLSQISNIAAIKECSGLSQVIQLCDTFKGTTFSVLTGCDPDTLAVMAVGGDGVLSVVSNLVPELMRALVDALMEGDLFKAQEIHFELMPLYQAAEVESNPIPIKHMLQRHGLPAGGCRLPLTSLNTRYHAQVEEWMMKKLGASTRADL